MLCIVVFVALLTVAAASLLTPRRALRKTQITPSHALRMQLLPHKSSSLRNAFAAGVCRVEKHSRWAPHYHSRQQNRVAPSSRDSALAASFIIFALFALASRATSTSRRWRHVSRHRRDAPRRYGVVPGRIRAAAAAVGLHVPAKASSHSVSSSARAGDWRPNPCTDLERKEWLAILKESPRRSK